MPQDFLTSVIRNVDLGSANFLLEFDATNVAGDMQPGQFFMIGIPGSEVLLRRPFSVCGLPGTFTDGTSGLVQVLYRVFGRGTSLLAALRAGSTIHVLGPLGRGFDTPETPDLRPIFVAGGIGSAPFPALSAMLKRGRMRPVLFYGARSAGDLPLLDWFRENSEQVVATTEDGTLGRKGLVTEPLVEMLDGADPSKIHLYACGPNPMLKEVARIAVARGVRCDLSLEAPMACGFGVCLGCVLPCRSQTPGETHYARVCVEGPVMRAEMIAW